MATLPPFNIGPATEGNTQQQVSPTTPQDLQAPPRGKQSLITEVFRGIWHVVSLNWKMGLGFTIVGIFILLAIFGPLLARYNPSQLSQDILQPPSAQHWLGTTQAGEDVFAQVMIGTRYSIFWGLITAILVTFIYVAIGLSAGYFSGIIDDILMAITNVFIVIPSIPLMLVIAAYIPYKGSLLVVIAIAITSWAGHARTLRSQTLSVRNRDFVEAARVSGLPTWRIIFQEIFPNMITIVAAGFVGTMIGVILAAAGLEYLGLGDIRSVSWGSMFYWAQSGDALLQGAWWWFVPPGICILALSAALAFINLGLDELADPRLRIEQPGSKRRKKDSQSEEPVLIAE
ncbi:MAG TPA: ABC transporter permease [Ktedonobacteraceae bacterium]|nr:ABC transporter permease [Ktedonobacteraceae bacterium]